MGRNGNIVPMLGKRFGDLVVVRREGSLPRSPTGKSKNGKSREGTLAAWRCLCDCGQYVVVTGYKLRQGAWLSCAKNGHYYRHPMVSCTRDERLAYDRMLDRCYNKKSAAYKNYGGRGIEVCKRWRERFDDFVSDVGPRPSSEHSLDRYPNNDGDYEPGNCRWATDKEQCRNTRRTSWVEWRGEQRLFIELCEEHKIKSTLVRKRLKAGWNLHEALCTASSRPWKSGAVPLTSPPPPCTDSP